MSNITPSPVLSQPVNQDDAHRRDAGCAPRGGPVVPGELYTMPNGTTPEIAREIYVGQGTGTITLRQIENIGPDGSVVSGDVTFYVTGGRKIHMMSTMVLDNVSGTVSDLVWLA